MQKYQDLYQEIKNIESILNDKITTLQQQIKDQDIEIFQSIENNITI